MVAGLSGLLLWCGKMCLWCVVGVVLTVDFVLVLFAPGDQRAHVGYRAKGRWGCRVPPQQMGSCSEARTKKHDCRSYK